MGEFAIPLREKTLYTATGFPSVLYFLSSVSQYVNSLSFSILESRPIKNTALVTSPFSFVVTSVLSILNAER